MYPNFLYFCLQCNVSLVKKRVDSYVLLILPILIHGFNSIVQLNHFLMRQVDSSGNNRDHEYHFEVNGIETEDVCVTA